MAGLRADGRTRGRRVLSSRPERPKRMPPPIGIGAGDFLMGCDISKRSVGLNPKKSRRIVMVISSAVLLVGISAAGASADTRPSAQRSAKPMSVAADEGGQWSRRRRACRDARDGFQLDRLSRRRRWFRPRSRRTQALLGQAVVEVARARRQPVRGTPCLEPEGLRRNRERLRLRPFQLDRPNRVEETPRRPGAVARSSVRKHLTDGGDHLDSGGRHSSERDLRSS